MHNRTHTHAGTHSLIKLASEGCSRLKILSHRHFPLPAKLGYFTDCRKNDDNHDNDDANIGYDDCHTTPLKYTSHTNWIYFWTSVLLFLSSWLLLNHRGNGQSRPNEFVEIENYVWQTKSRANIHTKNYEYKKAVCINEMAMSSCDSGAGANGNGWRMKNNRAVV